LRKRQTHPLFESFKETLKEISGLRKELEKILRGYFSVRRQKSLTAAIFLSPQNFGLPADKPFPENLSGRLKVKDYKKVEKIWKELTDKIQTVFETHEELLESYRRQILSHYFRALRKGGQTNNFWEDQREDLYLSLNLGIIKAFLCYDSEKEKDDPAKFFLKVMRGVLRAQLSVETWGVFVPPAQYQRIVTERKGQIPRIVPMSSYIEDDEFEERENQVNEDIDDIPNNHIPIPTEMFDEIELRDIIRRLPTPLPRVVQDFLDGYDLPYPKEVSCFLLTIASVILWGLLAD